MLVELTRCLVDNAAYMVFLVVRGNSIRKVKLVRNYLSAALDGIELFFLPSSASKLDLDQLVLYEPKYYTSVARR